MEPIDTTSHDAELKKLGEEITLTEEKIGGIVEKSERVAVEDWHRDETRLARLRRERTQTDQDIESAKTEITDEKKKAASRPVFKRLFANSDALKVIQTKLDSLVDKREDIEREMKALEEDRVRKQSEVKKYDLEIADLRSSLEELKLKLGEVETQKQERLQIAERRNEVTKSMVALISTLHLEKQTPPPPSSESDSSTA
jgi:chromosome segregation ATPase